MPLTLRCYLHRAISAAVMASLVLAVMIYVLTTEDQAPVVVFAVFLLPLVAFALYTLGRSISLRHAFAKVTPKRGSVVRRIHGLWAGSDRLVIAYDGQEYTTASLFFSGETAAFVGCDVTFALGKDGYVFVFQIFD